MEDSSDDNFSKNNNIQNTGNIYTDNSKQYNYIKTHSSLDENTVEENFDISNFNYNYTKKNKIIINKNDEEEEEEENDISSEDEYEFRLKNIKIGILKVKLNILNKIILSKIQKYLFYFISKIHLKIKSNEIFLKDDNFLYSKLKLKTSEANKFYALKKLVYVIRKNSYEKLMKQNYFYHWKIMKENKYLFNKNKESYSINAVQFCSILIGVLNKKLENNYYHKFFLNKWRFLMKDKEIYKNKIKKGMLILSSLFNRKIRKIFKKFPKNSLNLKQKANIFKTFNNNSQIAFVIEDNDQYYQKGMQDFYNYKKKYINLLKQNKLLKIIGKLDIKNKVNRNVSKFFHILKYSSKINKYKKEIKNLNNSLTDLKYDSMLNAAIILKIILNAHISNNLFFNKKIFLEGLYTRYKYNIIKNKYHNKEEMNNNIEKNEIKNIRLKYRRIFALQKILIINNRHKFYYSDLNIQLKFSLLWKYFKIWRKNVFDLSINECIKKLATQKIFLLLNNIYLYKAKKDTFFHIKKKSIQISFIKKKYYYFSFFIFLLLKKHLLIDIWKNAFYFLKQIWTQQQNSKFNNNIIYLQCKKLYLIYKKYNNIRKYKYFNKWYFICSYINGNKKIFQEKMKSILINYEKNNNKNILSNIFDRWQEKIQEKNDEEQKRQIKINFYLNKFLIMKHLMTLWLYLKKWSATTINLNNGLNNDILLIELQKIKKENDDLIAIYYKKRQEYAKTLYDYKYMKKFYCDNCINEKEDEINYLSLKSNDIKEAGKEDNSYIVSPSNQDVRKDLSKNIKKSLEGELSKQKSGNPILFDENNFVVNEENQLQTNNSNVEISDDNDINSNYVGRKIEQLNGESIMDKNGTEDYNFDSVFNNINEKENDINNDDINDYKKEYEEQKKYYENYINILLEKKNELMEMKKMLMNQKLNSSKIE